MDCINRTTAPARELDAIPSQLIVRFGGLNNSHTSIERRACIRKQAVRKCGRVQYIITTYPLVLVCFVTGKQSMATVWKSSWVFIRITATIGTVALKTSCCGWGHDAGQGNNEREHEKHMERWERPRSANPNHWPLLSAMRKIYFKVLFRSDSVLSKGSTRAPPGSTFDQNKATKTNLSKNVARYLW